MSEPQALTLECGAELEWSEIEAAEGGEKVPTFTMTAYTGGPMRVGGFFRPVVVDLAGVKLASKQVPIFRDHDPSKIVGHGSVEISASDIKASGVVSADNEHSRDVMSSSRKGFPWQASIGASVEEFENIPKDTKVTVNGKAVNGPVLVARKTLLNEISFVPLGADRRTSARVAATLAQLHSSRPVTVSLAQLHSRRKEK